jgi:hypothetical protein
MAGDFRVEASEFSQLLRDAKEFDRKLGLGIRRNIRDAAKPIVADVKATVQQPPPGDRPGSVGTRAAIARGLSVRVSTGKNGGGVTIAASSKALPANRKPMLRLYNKAGGWRHPVFGTGAWAHQRGRPYFGSVIESHLDDVRAAVGRALDEAATALGRRR